eukprot:GILJ01003639.1.p1 GENE.GILJ01003639.1~~GILJ01003639.1.p1  ORF type:complete len:623 (+),score=85.13 GILJ01003639.1:42-1910(+)
MELRAFSFLQDVRSSLNESNVEPAFLWLIGSFQGASFTVPSVLSVVKCLLTMKKHGSVVPDFENERAILKRLLPFGLYVVGMAITTLQKLPNERVSAIVKESRSVLSLHTAAAAGERLVVQLVKRDADANLTADIYTVDGVPVRSLPLTAQDLHTSFAAEHVAFRSQTKLEFHLPAHTAPSASACLSSLQEGVLHSLREPAQVACRLPQANIFLSSLSADIYPWLLDSCGRGLLSSNKQEPKVKKKPAVVTASGMFYEVQILRRQSSQPRTDSGFSPVPLFAPELVLEQGESRLYQFKIDVVTYVNLESTLGAALALHFENVVSQIESCANLQSVYPESELCAFQFQPEGIPHTLTGIYALDHRYTEIGDAEHPVLLTERRLLHQRLGLPMNRPLIRVSDAIPLHPSTDKSLRLKDVHVGLPPSGVVDGTQYLVQGSYLYFHYMQDRFDDKGWGCAYRSLQTLISWFNQQHYTTVAIPDHSTVQQILVDANDKNPRFVGSKEWIGALEVMLVLDIYLGVSSKILNVSSGSELAEHGRELARHFSSHGTPIMMGGGVLAYTLLGIDFNESTGDIRFLILDPHYTGPEDLKTIQDKGWVGWKTADLFVRDAFYNLCMPQRPNMI